VKRFIASGERRGKSHGVFFAPSPIQLKPKKIQLDMRTLVIFLRQSTALSPSLPLFR
jgi:hypothetical protein